MLNKLKVTMIVGLVLQVLRVFAPDLPTPEDFAAQIDVLVNALFVVVPVIAGWLVRESKEKIATLKTV